MHDFSVPRALVHRVREFRQALHANPRVSNHEADTARAIRDFLRPYGLHPTKERVGGGAGLVYEVTGTKSEKMGCTPEQRIEGRSSVEHTVPTVLLRADMDALPLMEGNNFSHASKTPGAHHACGHDGHIAMMAGALVHLLEHSNSFFGEVRCVFQPAEETGDGAQQMIEGERLLLGSSISRGAFALHNIPGVPLGRVIVRDCDGIAARASTGIRVKFSGRSSHASEPHLGFSPLNPIGRLVASGMISQLPDCLVEEGKLQSQIKGNRALVTPVHAQVGEDGNFGILPGDGVLCLTLRADTTEDLEVLRDECERLVRKVAAEDQVGVSEFSSHEWFPATWNSHNCTQIVKKSAKEFAAVDYEEMKVPFPWSEDFGWFTQASASGGCLFGIGAGEEHPVLHSSTYDFPDDLLPLGIELWTRIAVKALSSGSMVVE